MVGMSYGQLLVIIGSAAAIIGPKDLPKIAKTGGRLAGRAIAYVQLARGQFDNIMQHSQFRQVNKELQDSMAQLEAIRYEIRSFSLMNQGPLTQKVMGVSTTAWPSTQSVENNGLNTQQAHHPLNQQPTYNFKAETNAFKEHALLALMPSNLYSQTTMYSKLAESQRLKAGAMEDMGNKDNTEDRPGLLSVLPVSAESVSLLPNRHGDVAGSDIVLESLLEAEVARNAKEFFSQPQNQIKSE